MNFAMRALTGLVILGFTAMISSPVSAQEFKTKLHGKWKPNIEKTKEALSKLEGDQKIPVEMIDMMTEMMGSMVIEFTAEGAMKMSMSMGDQEQTQEGKFEVTKANEEEKTLEIKVTINNNEDDGKIVFLKDDQLKIVAGDEPPIVLDRLKKKEGDGKVGDGKN